MSHYTHLIILSRPTDLLPLKEFLDIALVSASYDISTAVFINHTVIEHIQQNPSIELEQSFKMLTEFSVPIFSEQPNECYGTAVTADCLDNLRQQAQHHFECLINS